MADPLDLEPADIDVALQADRPVVVLLWAPWTAGGAALDALLAPFVTHFAHKALFYRVNADEAPDLLARFSIHTLPAVLVFSQGSPVAFPLTPGDLLTHELRRRIYRLLGR